MKNISQLFPFVFVGLSLKWGITYLNFESIKWLLEPVRRATEFYTGFQSTTLDLGYLFPNNILLSFECSGIHFYVITFLSLWFIGHQYMNHLRSIATALFCAYLVTIVANTCRILFFISEGLSFIQDIIPHQLSHQLLGGVIFCFWLGLASIIYQSFITKNKSITYETV